MTLLTDIQISLTDILEPVPNVKSQPSLFPIFYLLHSHDLYLVFSIDYFPKVSKLFGNFFLSTKLLTFFFIAHHHMICKLNVLKSI